MRIIFDLFLICVLFLGPGIYPTFAYQCEQPAELSVETQKATAIFSGKVVNIELGHKLGIAVKFEIERVWKGNLKKIVLVYADTLGGSGYGFCDVELKIGQSYLVYAFGTDYLSTNICNRGIGICSRTRLLSLASEDLAILGPGELPLE